MKKLFCKTSVNPFFFPLLSAVTIFIIIAIMPNQLMATEVGGMISENTVWDLAGSPYNIISDVQVKDGVTLTIEPGVEVNGNRNKILNAGKVLASGVKGSVIVFKDVVFENADEREYALLDFDYCNLNHGSYFNGWFTDGSLVITNSVLDGPKQLTIFLLGVAFGSDEKVELVGNILIDIGALVLLDSTTTSAIIANNVFIGNSYISSEHVADIHYNSFLNTDIEVIRIRQYGNNLNATNNFWNTTDTGIIESMIFDANDDLNITGYVTYDPFLTAPHPDTPPVAKASFNAYPTVGKAPLEVNFIDQSAGEITSWGWDFGDDLSSTDQNPSHTYTNLGNYTVRLTVTDIFGIQDTYSHTITLRDKIAMPWIPLLLLDD